MRRKAGALREAVIVALQAKLDASGSQVLRARFEEAERSLRNAAASVEEARRACIDQTDDMRSLNEAVVTSALSSFISQQNGRRPRLSSDLIQSAAESATASASRGLAARLGETAERLQDALLLAEQTLQSNEAPREGELTRFIRELPRFELAIPALSLRPPSYLPSPNLARSWLSRRVERSAGRHLEAAFTGFSRALAARCSMILAELQSRFDERADVYRAQLGRMISSKRLEPQEQAQVERDLAELEHRAGAYSGDSPFTGRIC